MLYFQNILSFVYDNFFQISHPLIDDYFDVFDGTKYSPQLWLAAMYPED